MSDTPLPVPPPSPQPEPPVTPPVPGLTEPTEPSATLPPPESPAVPGVTGTPGAPAVPVTPDAPGSPATPDTPAAARPAQSVKPERPRRVRGGVRLRAREMPAAAGPWAQRWRRLLENRFPVEARLDGLEYARLGQTASMEIDHGTIRAIVQGRRARPYETSLSVSTLGSDQWEQLVREMAAEAVFAAKLIAGEVPQSLDDLAARIGVEFVPESPAALAVECTCGDTRPCKHAAAVAWLMAERLDTEPQTMLMLRGVSPVRLVDRLRQARAVHTAGVASTHADPLIPESQTEPPPLELSLDDYWRPGPQLNRLLDAAPVQYSPHALLRRLGASPLRGRFPLSGLLASIYDTVTETSERMREEAERVD